jgi:hypothetical protein
MRTRNDSIDDTTLKAMIEQLPSVENLQKTVLQLSPDLISIKLSPGNRIPEAAVCLQDAINVIAEAHYALRKALGNRIEYTKQVDQRDQIAALYFTRFYADDVALRLYAAGEHLAAAIVDMLEINQENLTRYKKTVSRQAIVGKYLATEKPNHPITVAVLSLAKSPEWEQAIKYRGDWVHNQPPLVKGLGIVYKRGQRWKLSETGNEYTLGFGGGDPPEVSVDDLLKSFHKALVEFITTSNAIVQFYVELLEKRGFN